MFETLSSRLGGIFEKLKRRGAVSEADVKTAMREVRIALLEADVALPTVKQFIKDVSEKAVGQDVLRSVTPGQQIIKVVHDELVALLGEASEQIDLNSTPPVGILMVGLQGSGKTTSSGKIAKRFKEKQRKKVLLASLDTRRPAAQEQLQILGEQIGVDSLPIIKGQSAVDIAKRAMDMGRKEAYDVVMLDTAGRQAIAEDLMVEVVDIRNAVTPAETLLVVDAMTGQDAVTVADKFHKDVGLTGIVMTRIDGDARGGAALSMRSITGCPIKLLGTGETLDALEPFHPDRIASRILGMGDVVSLVEKAAENIAQEDAEGMLEKLMSGQYDLNDLKKQLQQMNKMGGMSGIMKMLPGMGKMQKAMEGANIDDNMVKHQIAIIDSMTPKERMFPKLMNAKRKKRVAAGSGTNIQEINKILKQHKQMAKMMKKMKKMGGKKGGLGAMASMLGGGKGGLGALMGGMGGGGMPDMGQLGNMAGAGGMGGAGGGKGAAADGMPDLSDLISGKGGEGMPDIGDILNKDGSADLSKMSLKDMKALQDMLKGQK